MTVYKDSVSLTKTAIPYIPFIPYNKIPLLVFVGIYFRQCAFFFFLDHEIGILNTILYTMQTNTILKVKSVLVIGVTIVKLCNQNGNVLEKYWQVIENTFLER